MRTRRLERPTAHGRACEKDEAMVETGQR